ncbi:MAG: ATP-grasp domain-containing protein [Bacteroidales bacterium]|nr:ATP-grasp domain-containing protein [Bacteroidales bacterium]
MKALVIAGGLPQIELIQQLKQRGYQTVLADGSPQAVARPYADTFYHVDVFDTDAIRQIAEREKVDFLITVCADQVLLVVAEVSQQLGLPCYIDNETAQNVSDKLRMKRIFSEHGVPTTHYVEMHRLDWDRLKALRYPLVVKPVDAYSSKGVRRVDHPEQLQQYYEEAHNISRSGGVIVEEYFEGEEVSVDAFVVNGQAKILAITNSDKVKDRDRFVIFRGRYPAAIPNAVRMQIETVAQQIAEAFQLNNAPLLIQLLHNGKDISVLEFCARTGGNMKYLLIKYSCGVDVIGATIDITTGQAPQLAPVCTTYPIVVNDFVYCRPGVFDHFEGFDTMEQEGLINEFHAVRLPGTEMRGVTSSSDRVAGMNIVAQTVDEYNQKLNKINQNVRVVSREGLDIMRHDLLPTLA